MEPFFRSYRGDGGGGVVVVSSFREDISVLGDAARLTSPFFFQ